MYRASVFILREAEAVVKRLKSPEEENARLKQPLAKAMLDKGALQVALG